MSIFLLKENNLCPQTNFIPIILYNKTMFQISLFYHNKKYYNMTSLIWLKIFNPISVCYLVKKVPKPKALECNVKQYRTIIFDNLFINCIANINNEQDLRKHVYTNRHLVFTTKKISLILHSSALSWKSYKTDLLWLAGADIVYTISFLFTLITGTTTHNNTLFLKV